MRRTSQILTQLVLWATIKMKVNFYPCLFISNHNHLKIKKILVCIQMHTLLPGGKSPWYSKGHAESKQNHMVYTHPQKSVINEIKLILKNKERTTQVMLTKLMSFFESELSLTNQPMKAYSSTQSLCHLKTVQKKTLTILQKTPAKCWRLVTFCKCAYLCFLWNESTYIWNYKSKWLVFLTVILQSDIYQCCMYLPVQEMSSRSRNVFPFKKCLPFQEMSSLSRNVTQLI